MYKNVIILIFFTIWRRGSLLAIYAAMITASTPLANGADALLWDYTQHPVKVTSNKPRSDSPWEQRFWDETFLSVQTAFDGFGSQGTQPAANRSWMMEQPATNDNPHICTIDYGIPVAVSAFVNYFYTPESRDLKWIMAADTAWKTVRISSSMDGSNWTEIALLKDLSRACPQVLPIPNAKAARYWQISILESASMAEALLTYEIQTYTGGVPAITRNEDLPLPDFLGSFIRNLQKHKSVDVIIPSDLSQGKDGGLKATFKGKELRVTLSADGKTAPFSPLAKGWEAAVDGGTIGVNTQQTVFGPLLLLSFKPRSSYPIDHKMISISVQPPSGSKPEVYYMPSSVCGQPRDISLPASNVQTRLVSFTTDKQTFCLVPGTDRGSLGISSDNLQVDLLVGPHQVPVLLMAVQGDWWTAYRVAVTDIYKFGEQLQTKPVSEIQYGISRYIMSNEVWDPVMGTLKSWPQHDPHTYAVGFTDYFNTYGSTFSIPAFWARYRMNGDQQALERMKSVAHWLVHSGVRSKEGPTAGAFYTLQRFPTGEELKMDKPGSTQASTNILTNQATGAALWTLQLYRKLTKDKDPEITTAIQQAADWLLKTQTLDGGWPYGHEPDGKEVSLDPTGGCIYNIWALWRLGKETNDHRYFEAARRGSRWFEKTFVEPHYYHGYYDEIDPRTAPPSREGYEAAIAAIAFGEMGEKQLAISTAKDAIQWVFTRQIECREANNSAGLVSEQIDWSPASYCNPMVGLAAWTAWQLSGDDFFRPFAMIPKAIGWWYQPETGAMVWIVESVIMGPIVGPAMESWWSDWCIAQVGTLSLQWLTKEVVRRAGGQIELDEEFLEGHIFGESVTAWSPSGGLRPILPSHGQVNWLGFRSQDRIFVAFMNDGAAGNVTCDLDSRAVGSFLSPVFVHQLSGNKDKRTKWNGGTAPLAEKGMTILEWKLYR